MKTIVRRIAALLAAGALGIGLAAANAPAAQAEDTSWPSIHSNR